MSQQEQISQNEEEDISWSYVHPNLVFHRYKNKNQWYQKGIEYWENVDANDSGMLGGFPQVSPKDVISSSNIIEKIQKEKKMGNEKAADVAAGIGRVSKLVLSKYFKRIDAVEPVQKFLNVYEKELKNVVDFTLFCCGAQEWQIEDSYDCFWIQWALMFLRDDDAINFLLRCRNHLSKNGHIFVKDNVAGKTKDAPKEESCFYPDDRSITRTYLHFMELFTKAELILVDEVIDIEDIGDNQTDNELNLMPVYTFVLAKNE